MRCRTAAQRLNCSAFDVVDIRLRQPACWRFTAEHRFTAGPAVRVMDLPDSSPAHALAAQAEDTEPPSRRLRRRRTGVVCLVETCGLGCEEQKGDDHDAYDA